MKMLCTLALPAAFILPVTLVDAAPASLTSTAIVTVQDDGAKEIARGNVTKIDAAAKSFDIKTDAEGAKAVTITWNDATVFMLEGKVAKWDEVVKEKVNLTVTHKKGVATLVEANAK